MLITGILVILAVSVDQLSHRASKPTGGMCHESIFQVKILLEMKGIGKTFPGVKALEGVNLTVREGRCMPCWARTAPANPP